MRRRHTCLPNSLKRRNPCLRPLLATAVVSALAGTMAFQSTPASSGSWVVLQSYRKASNGGLLSTRLYGGSATAEFAEGDAQGEVKTTCEQERADAMELKQQMETTVSPDAIADKGNVKHLVRGDIRHDYHVYAARPTVDLLKERGFQVHVLGGGRLQHSPNLKVLKLWGKSHAFGREDKSITLRVCQAAFPEYTVTASNEGY